MIVFWDITGTVGNTPMVYLGRTMDNAGADVVAKLEFFNPASSVKDRIAVSMIDSATAGGKIHPGTVVVEPTSGNTGIGLAMVCAARGIKLKIFMPENFSQERRAVMKTLGAELSLTPKEKGMKGAIEAATMYCRENPETFMPMQFENPANPEIHYKTTGPEIWRDTGGKVNIFVAGVGTGGTLTGAGKFLKEKNPDIKIIAVEPAASPVLSGGKPGPHRIQGIGAGFIPGVLDMSLIDQVITVTDDEVNSMLSRLAREEGLFVGGSSAAAAVAAGIVARREENRGKLIATIFPDAGDRYITSN